MPTVTSGSTWAPRDGTANPPTPLDAHEDGYQLKPSQASYSLNETPHDPAAQYGPASNLESLPGQYSDGLSNVQSRPQYSQTLTESANDPSALYASEFACSWPTCALTFTRLSERDRHYITDHANNRDRPYKCEVEKCKANVTTWTKPDKLRRHNKTWHGPYHCQVANCVRGFPCGFSSSNDLDDHVRSTHKGNKQDHEIGPAQFAPAHPTTSSGLYQQLPPSETMAQISSDNVRERYSTKPSHPGDKQTIWGSHSGSTISTGLSAVDTKRESHFKVHESKRFKFGKVFKLIWSEPEGSNGTDISDDESQDKVSMHRKTRRFVIVNSFPGHSLCLPILTYGGQGTLKWGVHPDDHAVIYTDRTKGPVTFTGECLRKPALRMEPDNSRHKLHPASRVNYAKVYTVEHNVKVQFIGGLTRNAQAQLSADYNSQHPPIPEIEPETGYVVRRSPGPVDWSKERSDQQPIPSSSYYNSQTQHIEENELQSSYFTTPIDATRSNQWNPGPASSLKHTDFQYSESVEVSPGPAKYEVRELASS